MISAKEVLESGTGYQDSPPEPPHRKLFHRDQAVNGPQANSQNLCGFNLAKRNRFRRALHNCSLRRHPCVTSPAGRQRSPETNFSQHGSRTFPTLAFPHEHPHIGRLIPIRGECLILLNLSMIAGGYRPFPLGWIASIYDLISISWSDKTGSMSA